MSVQEMEARGITALVADLDGVITRTADVHFRAWKRLFDSYLRDRAAARGEDFVPFIEDDYTRHVDGKPRWDGVRDFLAARSIALAEGTDDDPPEAETVRGLGNRKNGFFRRAVEEDGVTVFDGAVALLNTLTARGMRLAVVSSSRNCRMILEAAGLMPRFGAVVDGNDATRTGLPGKPKPDTFLEAARQLGVPPAQAAVAEDAVVGVQAGRAGGFGLVIGIDRGAGADALRAGGADIVVSDLGDIRRD